MSNTTSTNQLNLKIIIILSTILLAIMVWLLWMIAENIPALAVQVWAIVATLLVPAVAILAFWFGKTEVRGFLAGADQMTERVASIFMHAIDSRDVSRIRIHNATNAPLMGQGMGMPNDVLPRIAARSAAPGGEIEL